MKKFFLFILFLPTLSLPAQNHSSEQPGFNSFRDSIKVICKKLYASAKDEDKKKYNARLLSSFENALNTPNSYSYPFDSLTDISILTSPDKKFRIINWNIPYTDGTQEYFGFIQENYTVIRKKGLFKKEKSESILLFPLTDKSNDIKNPDNYIGDNKKWFGMLYYKIIEKKTKSKTYYTLLGWDGNDKISTKKIIDVLTFDNNGTPRFGADIFNMEKKYPKRVIFEYASSCTISVRYSDKKDSIVFDHLAPTQPQLTGQYQYYCNDGSYDGFGFKRGKWNYGMYLNAINEKDNKDKIYNDPHNEGRTKESRNFKKDIKDNKKKKQK